jgi:hypothetical protein
MRRHELEGAAMKGLRVELIKTMRREDAASERCIKYTVSFRTWERTPQAPSLGTDEGSTNQVSSVVCSKQANSDAGVNTILIDFLTQLRVPARAQ